MIGVMEMADVPMDACMHCGKDYALSEENARLQLFVRTPDCNFIQANCPHCDGWTRIFITIDTTCELIETLAILLFADAPAEIAESWARVNGAPQQEADVSTEIGDDTVLTKLPELDELPPDLRRQLYDWMRETDHE